MVKRINLNKNVFNKEDFLKTIDTSFSQLVSPSEEEEPPFTVANFFEQYEILFFEIPKEGEVNSHQYLAQKSGEYANFERTNAEIQALLEEITSLREQNLDLNQQLIDTQIDLAQVKGELQNAQSLENQRKERVQELLKTVDNGPITSISNDQIVTVSNVNLPNFL